MQHFYEQNGDAWRRHEHQLLEVPTAAGNSSDRKALVAFVTAGPGPFLLVSGAAAASPSGDILPSTNPMVEGSPVRAAANSLWPLAVFAVLWHAARRRHRRESR